MTFRALGTVRRSAGGGFTITEMMVATLIMMAVIGAVFSVMNPAQGTFHAQPEVSDMQQRIRVGVGVLTQELLMAGAGTYMGSSTGALYRYFAPVMPYRIGEVNNDPTAGVFYRADTLSLMYVPPTTAQTGVNKAAGDGLGLDVDAGSNCGNDKHDQLCGFKEGQRVLIYDPSGSWDRVTLTSIQDHALHFQYRGGLSSAYDSGDAVITEVAAHTFYLKTNPATNTYQLMHYDGASTDLPVVDNVVKLQFAYYGDPQPPTVIPGKSMLDTTGPWTTYGPKPPAPGVNHAGDTWGAGENCTVRIDNGLQVARLPVLANNEGQVPLTQAVLTDGPWCPDDAHANRYDADLLRIRRVRVTLRVQAAVASLRGPAGILFTHGGTSSSAERYVPDQEVRFDVTPRNMNLGR